MIYIDTKQIFFNVISQRLRTNVCAVSVGVLVTLAGAVEGLRAAAREVVVRALNTWHTRTQRTQCAHNLRAARYGRQKGRIIAFSVLTVYTRTPLATE